MDKYTFISYEAETYQSKQYRALLLANQVFYLGLSKTSPWSDAINKFISDENPPKPPTHNLYTLPELVIMKRMQEVKLARETSCGEHIIMGKTWNLYDPSDIQFLEGKPVPDVTHLYLKVLLKPNDFTTDVIRVLSLHSHISTLNNYREEVIPSSLITNQGIIHWVSYSTPLKRRDITNIYSEIRILLEI